MQQITYATVCSGIEAPSAAWEPLGLTPLWFSEIAKHPAKFLKDKFPNTPNLGDMTNIEDMINERQIEPPNILIGGTPCQAFSITGKRQGLSDDRGQLTLVYCRIADAIDRNRARQGLAPCVHIWENVPGVLSDKSNAFGCLLSALANGSDSGANPFASPSRKWPTAGFINGEYRRIAYRVLDSQYWGVPQRRRRVFVVSSARAGGIDPGKVLHDDEASTHNLEREGDWPRVGFTTSTCGTCGNANSRGVTIISERGRRSLTHREEERRQGFPDGWTCGMSDAQAFKALGNSMAVPVIRWIGSRVLEQMREVADNATP